MRISVAKKLLFGYGILVFLYCVILFCSIFYPGNHKLLLIIGLVGLVLGGGICFTIAYRLSLSIRKIREKTKLVHPIQTLLNEPPDGKSDELTFVADAFERMEKERLEVEERSQRVARIFDQSSNEIYIFQKDSLRFVEVNHQARTNLGFEIEELQKMTPLDLYLEYDEKNFREILDLVFYTEGNHASFTASQKRKNGSTYPVEVNLQYFSQESPPVFVAFALDISKRKEAEKAFLNTEALLRSIIETAAEGILLVDVDGRVHIFNPACERIFGYKKEAIYGRSLSLLLDESVYETFEHYLKEGMEGKLPQDTIFSRETLGVREDGGSFPIEITLSQTQFGGDTMYTGIIRDMTEKKQEEEEKRKLQSFLRQSRKMETIGTLAGGIAHDFNNMLTSILGFADLVKEDVEKETIAHKNIIEVLKAGQRARDLVQQILSFSRQTNVQKKPLVLDELVIEAQGLLKVSWPKKVELIHKLGEKRLMILADHTQILQVIINLGVNALQAMEESGGQLTIDVSEVELLQDDIRFYVDLKEGSYVLLSVSDTGPGIEKEAAERVFEPFFTTKKVGKGTGMGLSVVHGIVKAHDGEITIDSEIGKGTKNTNIKKASPLKIKFSSNITHLP